LARGVRFAGQPDGDRQGGDHPLSASAPATLKQIQALRGLAALSVVAFHALQGWGDGFWIGAAGVDVFFVISGFIIWREALRPGVTPGGFFWRRLTRVAPAYWLATVAVGAVALAWPRFMPEVVVSPSHLLLSLAFVPHADPLGRNFPLLPPGWTLDYEAGFYLLVTAVLLAPARARPALALAALALMSLPGFVFTPLYGLGANPMLLEFAAGVWLAHRASRGAVIPPGAGLTFAGLGAALLAAMWLGGFQDILWRPLLWGLPAVMIVAGALAAEPIRALTPPGALVRLGDASYAIYLCHMPAVALVFAALGTAPVWVFAPAAILASLVAGLAAHRFVERPLIAACRAIPARWSAMRSGRQAEPAQ
jgi:exopolysaccharide production protein ExoZ